MKLQDTIELMISDDFRDRFKCEYHQLLNRCEGLTKTIDKYKSGTLGFKPNAPLDLLQAQKECMDYYLAILEHRAVLENIELQEED